MQGDSAKLDNKQPGCPRGLCRVCKVFTSSLSDLPKIKLSLYRVLYYSPGRNLLLSLCITLSTSPSKRPELEPAHRQNNCGKADQSLALTCLILSGSPLVNCCPILEKKPLPKLNSCATKFRCMGAVNNTICRLALVSGVLHLRHFLWQCDNPSLTLSC